MNGTSLDFYGVTATIESSSESLLKDLDHDFSYFKLNSLIEKPRFRFTLRKENERPIDWVPCWKGPRSTIYWTGKGERRVCFFGKAWVAYHYEKGKIIIYSSDEHAAFEALYFSILSAVGEALDEIGLHRIHGLGISVNQAGGILLAPSGRCKSTLALELIRRTDIQILSDDTPLVDSMGQLHAFPQRISIKKKPDVPEEHLRVFKRFYYGEKYVVGASYFRDRIAKSSKLTQLITVSRNNHAYAEIIPISQEKIIFPLLKWLVIGYEVPQIWELYLRFSVTGLRKKFKILVSRLKLALLLFKTCKASRLILSNEPETSSRALQGFVLGNAF